MKNTMKRVFFLCSLSFGLFEICPAQPTAFQLTHSCAFDDAETDPNVYFFEPSDEASGIVNEIVDALGLSKNFSVKSAGVRNAVATEKDGLRYILYSTTFLEKLKAKGDSRWAAYGVLAHEIGHHLNNDNFAETDMRQRKLYELEADRFSGSVLRMLGANLTQAQSGIESIELEGESNTHPAKAARREAVATGWKKRDEFLKTQQQNPVVVSDQDGDGIPDSQDKCPTQKGPASNAGCPEKTNESPGRSIRDRRYDRDALPATFLNRKSGLDLLPVEGGTFTMGNQSEKGACEHQVMLADYFIGKYEITQADWLEVMGDKPAAHQPGDCADCPVEQVSWDEIQAFIQKLNTRYPGFNFRLPTEAEWEYAAKGGQLSRKNKYAGSNNGSLVAWYYGTSGRKPHPVGQRKANELGLYDMSGNVWEWCQDTFYPFNADCQQETDTYFATEKVVRGGAWNDKMLPSVHQRNSQSPDKKRADTGFRLAHD